MKFLLTLRASIAAEHWERGGTEEGVNSRRKLRLNFAFKFCFGGCGRVVGGLMISRSIF